tara:strand:+ start:4619 stop:5827 length:1209 start_codon:yes stop_codon:yes gene_type:complete
MEEKFSFKNIVLNTEKKLSFIKESKEDLNFKLIELNELKNAYSSHFNFQKNLVFQDIKKNKTKKQLIDFLNSIFKDIKINIYNINIDLNNIDFTIFDEKIKNVKKDIYFYNSEKKIKLKELDMTKKYLINLSIYKNFKRDFKDSIFDQYYTKNRNKILKNLGNKIFVKQYINDKYYKFKFSRCLLKDEFQYKIYKEEEKYIQNSLIELELNIIEKQKLLNNLIKSKDYLFNLKKEDFFINELNNFFIKNIDIQHSELIKNKNLNKYYFNYNIICLILDNLHKELFLLNDFYNEEWKFFKKIRCFQYTQKNRLFQIEREKIDEEISVYIKKLYNQYNIAKKILSLNLEVINQDEINNENDFLLFLNYNFKINIYENFNIKNNEKNEFTNIFKYNKEHIKNIDI